MLNNPTEYALMAAAEKRHWWYRVLHERTINALQNSPPNLGRAPRNGEGVSILDAGCGTGGLLLKLQEENYENILGADISEHALQICKQRGLNVIQSDVRDLPQKLNGQTFDAIICNDVLCYFTIEEIPAIIEGFKSLLKPGGLLIMNNPAYAAFAGNHDVAVGIKTRFQPKKLKSIIMNYELSIMHYCQWPFLLSPLIYLTRKLQRKKSGTEVVSDVSMPPLWLNNLLYSICKLEMKLFKRMPLGSSVFIVGRKG